MRTFGSIFLLIILVPATLAIVLVGSLKMNVVTAQFLKHELAAHQAYSVSEDQLSEQIGKVTFGDLPVNSADLQTLATRVLPASWLQQNVENILDRTFAWFNSPEGAILSLPVDLRGPKAELLPGVDALITAAIPRLPACSRVLKTDALCRTPNITAAQVKDTLRQAGIDLDTVTTQLPDSIDLANPVLPTIKLGTEDKNEQSAADTNGEPKETLQQQAAKMVDQLEKAKNTYHRALGYWYEALAAYAVLLLLYVAINIHGWHRLMRWGGILLLTISLLPLTISIASQIVLEKIAISAINFDSSVPSAVQALVPNIMRDLQHAWMFPVLLLSAIMAVLGLAGIIGACFIGGKSKKMRS